MSPPAERDSRELSVRPFRVCCGHRDHEASATGDAQKLRLLAQGH